MFKHRDLKEKLLETKLTQANMILKETEEKHKLERELVRNAQQTVARYQTKSDTSQSISSDFLQMLKQVSEYKVQMKALKEQENDMRSQVRTQGIVHTIFLVEVLCSILQKCTMFLMFLRSSTCTPRSLMKSRAPYQRVTASTAASNKTWTK